MRVRRVYLSGGISIFLICSLDTFRGVVGFYWFFVQVVKIVRGNYIGDGFDWVFFVQSVDEFLQVILATRVGHDGGVMLEGVRAGLGGVCHMKIAMKRGGDRAWVVGLANMKKLRRRGGSELGGGLGYLGVSEGFFFSIGLWPVQRSCSVTACGLHRRFGGFTVERTHSFFTCFTLSVCH